MQSKSILTLAVLSAALLPSTVFAQGGNAGGTQGGNAGAMSGGGALQDAGAFRENLNDIHEIFSEMRENSNLALSAGRDPLIASQYQQKNRRLLNRALGLFTVVSRNWSNADLSTDASTSTARMGTANMSRYASESEDTAFVRTTIWELQNRLQAAKLNGRDVVITDEMMSMLDAAIRRAENPSFRVARAFDANRLSRIDWGRREETTTTSAPSDAVATAQGAREWREVTIEHENLPSRIARAETTETEVETTTEERMGAADLPQTGGNPALLYMLGSSMMGVGGLFLRRRRS